MSNRSEQFPLAKFVSWLHTNANFSVTLICTTASSVLSIAKKIKCCFLLGSACLFLCC
jgi:hypothetical protein